MTLPSDPYFQLQWYLYNTGQGGRTPRIDLNLIDEDPNNFDVWEEYTGNGISIGVIDDGFLINHPDLNTNANTVIPNLPTYNYNTIGKPLTIEDNHGTAVTGIIAAARNGIGTVGVAYNAKVTSFNTISSASLLSTATALSAQVAFDISNNSWGGTAPFSDNPRYDRINRQDLNALRTATAFGRNGRGTVIVFAAGNSFEEGIDADLYAISSSRFSIAVAAVNGQGRAADYSSVGPALLVSAFAEGSEPTRGSDRVNIATTDRLGKTGYNPREDRNPLPDRDYTSEFNGTSAATPQVSGVVALMLEANPNLGYRDVQQILAYSAVQNFPQQLGWQFNGAKNWNGGGLHVNENYGYGIVNAHAAVRLAESWQSQGTAANEISLTSGRKFGQKGTAIPDRRNRFREISLPMSDGLSVNHAELDIQINHTAIEDLGIELVSPTGTRSLVFAGDQLTKKNAAISISDDVSVPFSRLRQNPELALELGGGRAFFRLAKFYQKGLNYKFTSTFHWGETSGGNWKVRVFDTGKRGKGQVLSAKVNLYGDPIASADTYIYTEEFNKFTDSDTINRRILNDTNGGIDTLNAAALRSAVVLNLEPGQLSTLAGNSLQIANGTVIENAIGGDGKDMIKGNSANNELRGGRNTDTLIGEGGNDVLLGGKQADTLIGCGAEHGINTIDQLTGGEGADQFILGDSTAIFYAEPTGTGDGLADYALITDFELGIDRIQLRGQAAQYRLAASPIANETGTALYLDRTTGSDLVAVLRGINPTALSLTATDFSYV
jgi:subtilisin-like proprotein convertase family protein